MLETKQSDDPCRKNRAKLEGRRKGGAEVMTSISKVATTKYKMIMEKGSRKRTGK